MLDVQNIAELKNAILVPGKPGKAEYYDASQPTNSNNHWFSWLAKHLQINDIFAVAIEPPFPWQPRYELWKKEFERFDIKADTLLIGHSCGAGFLVRWLTENKNQFVGKVVLVAPWLNPENDIAQDVADFFEFEIDPKLSERTKGLIVFNSDNDVESIQKSVQTILESIENVELQEFSGYGHFCISDLGTVEFPELLAEIVYS